jgi:hypothetical protein
VTTYVPEWLVDHPLRTSALLFLATVLGACLVASVGGFPAPVVHDEFAYRLLGETFAEGRLANPPHPHWQFFETFHVLQRPTYAAKYPPFQGVVLGLGQLIGGHPVLGVWISAGVMVAAVYWCLLQWFDPSWALVGAVLVLLQLGIVGDWAQSYWGGAIAATGGALVVGGARAVVRSPRPRYGVGVGVGLAVLANSRPFEGLVLASVAGCYLAWKLLDGQHRLGLWARSVAPTLIIGVATLAMMGIYNRAVTGDPFTFPYLEYESQYSTGAVFIWEAPDPLPEYRHQEFRGFYESYADVQRRHRTVGGFLEASLTKVRVLAGTLLGPGVLALLGLPHMLRKREHRLVGVTLGIMLCALLVTPGGWPHYFAPATALCYILLVQGIRGIHRDGFFRLGGHRLVKGIVLGFVILAGIRTGLRAVEPPEPLVEARNSVQSCLEERPVRDLVFVEYRPSHDLSAEFVYNRADIDGSPIVWARSISAERNRRLRDYYEDRRAWQLTVGGEETVLREVGSDEIVCRGPGV